MGGSSQRSAVSSQSRQDGISIQQETIPTLSIRQPWASAIACGAKQIETRSWRTHYRGLLLIHAAARRREYELIDLFSWWSWVGALWPLGIRMGGDRQAQRDALPFGALIAVAELVDCRPTASFTVGELDTKRKPTAADCEYPDCYTWTEHFLGDYPIGGYGWVLRNVRALKTPIPCKGRQGLFRVPVSILPPGTCPLPPDPCSREANAAP